MINEEVFAILEENLRFMQENLEAFRKCEKFYNMKNMLDQDRFIDLVNLSTILKDFYVNAKAQLIDFPGCEIAEEVEEMDEEIQNQCCDDPEKQNKIESVKMDTKKEEMIEFINQMAEYGIDSLPISQMGKIQECFQFIQENFLKPCENKENQ